MAQFLSNGTWFQETQITVLLNPHKILNSDNLLSVHGSANVQGDYLYVVGKWQSLHCTIRVLYISTIKANLQMHDNLGNCILTSQKDGDWGRKYKIQLTKQMRAKRELKIISTYLKVNIGDLWWHNYFYTSKTTEKTRVRVLSRAFDF